MVERQVWSGEHITNYDWLHLFRYLVYFHVIESKLDPRAKKAIFLDFSSGTKTYKLWCPQVKEVVLVKMLFLTNLECYN